MRSRWLWSLSLAAAVAGWSPRAARANPCLDAIQAPAPDRGQLEACLPSRPTVIVAGGASVTLPGGWSAFGAVDAPLPAHLWASGRVRWLGDGTGLVDAMIGLRLGGHYGTAMVWWTDHQIDATTTLDLGKASVVRTDWVLAAGAKAVFDGGADLGKTFQVGIQRHAASGFGTHKRIELYGVLRGSRIGATAVWHNAIPPIPWLVFGMEAGFVPYRTSGDMASDEQAIYWGLIDLGVSHEVGGGR